MILWNEFDDDEAIWWLVYIYIYIYDDTHGLMVIGILRSYGPLWTDLRKDRTVESLQSPIETVVAGVLAQRKDNVEMP